jgi:hypothetical protein
MKAIGNGWHRCEISGQLYTNGTTPSGQRSLESATETQPISVTGLLASIYGTRG